MKQLISNTPHIICSAGLFSCSQVALVPSHASGLQDTASESSTVNSSYASVAYPLPGQGSPCVPHQPPHPPGSSVRAPELWRASTHFSTVGDEGRNFTLDWQVICILQTADLKKKQTNNIKGGLSTSRWGMRMGCRDQGSCQPTQIPTAQSCPVLVKPCVLSTEV